MCVCVCVCVCEPFTRMLPETMTPSPCLCLSAFGPGGRIALRLDESVCVLRRVRGLGDCSASFLCSCVPVAPAVIHPAFLWPLL